MPISLRELKACKRTENFEFAGYEDEIIVMRRKASDFGRYVPWIRKHQWPARIVLVIGSVALVAVFLVFVLLVGAGL